MTPLQPAAGADEATAAAQRPRPATPEAAREVVPFGELVRFLTAQRKARGLSLRAMAKRVGISGPGVVNFEQRTHRAVRLDTLARYLTALGYTMTGFCLRGPGGELVTVGTGPRGPGVPFVPACVEGTPVPGRLGLVHGSCGHPVGHDEYAAGWHACEPCSPESEAAARVGV